ncbi:MAG: glyoxalase [Lachnospiraceae bacterium]|nr:glyoxalase [Lachnospiraceae bacterium]
MYDDKCLKSFLKNQCRLFPQKVAETKEEAEEFLEDSMAVVCENIKEVKAYFEECGLDIAGISMEELQELEEVFPIEDGRFLIVEG